jgi:hypothetical protein
MAAKKKTGPEGAEEAGRPEGCAFHQEANAQRLNANQ